MALVILGVVIVIAGLFVLWTATLGREWNSTHNRLFQKTDHVSTGQQRYNSVAGAIGGVVAVVLGVVCIVVR